MLLPASALGLAHVSTTPRPDRFRHDHGEMQVVTPVPVYHPLNSKLRTGQTTLHYHQ